MATVSLGKPRQQPRTKLFFGPEDNGLLLTPAEFDEADFDDDYRFELITGVLIVSPV